MENNENLNNKNSQIKDNFKILEEKSKEQETQIKELSSKLKIIQKENDNLIKMNSKTNENIIELEKKFYYEQSKNENLQKSKDEMNNLNTNLKTENDQLLVDNENIKNKLKETEDNYNKLNESYNDLKKKFENGNIVEEYTKIKNENERLKNENKLIDKKTEHDEILELNKTLNIELEKEKNKKYILEQKIEELKRQKNIQFDDYKKNDYNEEFIEKQLEEFYDVIINIKSINSLMKPEGWPIKWNTQRKPIIEKLKNEKLLKVGVLGNGNVGKSFLLSRLFSIKIPSGYSVITEGLSLKFNEKEFYTILDSAGLQTPLIKNEEILSDEDKNENESNKNEQKRKKYENLYKDKTQTENFIQNLIIYESDMLLIVVGKLTFNEQRLINKIKKEIESGPNDNKTSNKKIYIIHNLMNFHTKKQVEDHIKDTILKSASFNIEIQKYVDVPKKETNEKNKENENKIQNNNENNFQKVGDFYVENDNEIQVFHLFMAREGTEAGDYYNDFTYQFLKAHFNQFRNRNPLSIIEEIKNKFVEWSNDLLEESIKENNIEIVKDENNKENKYIFKESEGKNENNKLIPKACISDELGLSIYRSNGYEPPYYFYLENDEKLVVFLEIPGIPEENKIDDIHADVEKKEIIVKGSKTIIDSIKPLYNNSSKFGKFNLHIPYGNKI